MAIELTLTVKADDVATFKEVCAKIGAQVRDGSQSGTGESGGAKYQYSVIFSRVRKAKKAPAKPKGTATPRKVKAVATDTADSGEAAQ